MSNRDAEIRQFVKNQTNASRVRIRNDGDVHYCGSQFATERGLDVWKYWGTRESVVRELDSRDAYRKQATVAYRDAYRKQATVAYREVTCSATSIRTTGKGDAHLWALAGRIEKPAGARTFLRSAAECRRYIDKQG